MHTLTTMPWPDIEAQLREHLRATPHGNKRDLAALLHMTPTHLSQLISGKRPMTREVAERLADHYGLQITYTLDRKDQAQPR